jgi:phage shock protein C
MSTRKLRRTPHDKMVAGVCGGIAEYFGIDSTLVRVAYVILGIMTTGFPALLVYIMLAFIMPEY